MELFFIMATQVNEEILTIRREERERRKENPLLQIETPDILFLLEKTLGKIFIILFENKHVYMNCPTSN